VVTSISAKTFRKLSFELRPTLREIRILIKMWDMRDVVVLTDIHCVRIIPAIRWMIAQGLHTFFAAFIFHDGVVVSTCCFHTDSLKLVRSCVGFIFAVQLSFEWIIWLVLGGFCAHDLPVTRNRLPTMGSSVLGAQRFCGAAMMRCICAKFVREFGLELIPSGWKISVIIPMRRVRDMIGLTYVHRFRIGFAV